MSNFAGTMNALKMLLISAKDPVSSRSQQGQPRVGLTRIFGAYFT